MILVVATVFAFTFTTKLSNDTKTVSKAYLGVTYMMSKYGNHSDEAILAVGAVGLVQGSVIGSFAYVGAAAGPAGFIAGLAVGA